MIKLGNNEIKSAYLGATPLTAIYKGDVLLWQKGGDYEVEFNQIIVNGNFTDTSWWNPYANTTISAENNICKVECLASAGYTGLRGPTISTENGHIYYFTFDLKFNIGADTILARFIPPTRTINYSSLWQKYSFLGQIDVESSALYLAKNRNDVDYSFFTKEIMASDLTQMFGAGNEPSDVAEYEAWLAENNRSGYQPYNEGEIIKTTKPSWIP